MNVQELTDTEVSFLINDRVKLLACQIFDSAKVRTPCKEKSGDINAKN
jgi:hypothetical protein